MKPPIARLLRGTALLLVVLLCALLLWPRDDAEPHQGAGALAAEALRQEPAAPTAAVTTASTTAVEEGARSTPTEEASSPDEAGAPTALDEGPFGTNRGKISGVVTDPAGRPVPGATVRWEAGCTLEDSTTDADGRYALTQAPVTWLDVRVYPPHDREDLLGTTRRVRVSQGGAEVDLDLSLPRPVALQVEVVWPDGVQPSLDPDDPDGPAPIVTATAQEGEFQTEGWFTGEATAARLEVLPGRYLITVRDDEQGLFGRAEAVATAEGGRARVRLVSGGALRGRVLGADGSPLRAEVLLKTSFNHEPTALAGDDSESLSDQQDRLRPEAGWDFDVTSLSDSAGGFLLTRLPPGPAKLVVIPLDTVHGRLERDLDLRPGAAQELTLRLARTPSTPVRCGQDLRTARIQVRGPAGVGLVRDGASELSVTGLAPGEQACVVASQDDWEEDGWVAVVAVRGGGGPYELIPALAARLRLLAVDAGGRPLGAGVRFSVRSTQAKGLAWSASLHGGDPEDFDRLGARELRTGAPPDDDLVHAWDTQADGRTDGSVDLAPGRWEVSLVDGPQLQTVELGPGERRELTLVVR